MAELHETYMGQFFAIRHHYQSFSLIIYLAETGITFLQRKSFQGLGCCVFLKSNLFGKFITTLSGRKPQLRFEFSSDSCKYSLDIPLSQIIGRFCWKVWIRVGVWVQGLSFVVNFNFCWRNSVSTRLTHNDDLAWLRYLMIMIIIQTNSSNTNTYLLIQELPCRRVRICPQRSRQELRPSSNGNVPV